MTADPGPNHLSWARQPTGGPPEDIWGALGIQARASGWVITWSAAPPDWAAIRHPDIPGYLHLRVRVAPTEDGFAPVAVLIERDDGRAISARDLRRVKLPPAWALAAPLIPPLGSPPVSRPRRGKGADHWQAVLRLLAEAERVAPRTPVRWMREQWPGDVSDATMRRWIARARAFGAGQDQAAGQPAIQPAKGPGDERLRRPPVRQARAVRPLRSPVQPLRGRPVPPVRGMRSRGR